MKEFDYQAPAEIYARGGRGFTKRAIRFYRFNKAAEAIRFVMEELPGEMLLGTIMEVGEERFIGMEIKRLYGSDDFPLVRTFATSTGMLAT